MDAKIMLSVNDAKSVVSERNVLYASEALDLCGHFDDLKIIWVTAEQIPPDLKEENEQIKNCSSDGIFIVVRKNVSQIFKRLQAQEHDWNTAVKLANEKIPNVKDMTIFVPNETIKFIKSSTGEAVLRIERDDSKAKEDDKDNKDDSDQLKARIAELENSIMELKTKLEVKPSLKPSLIQTLVKTEDTAVSPVNAMTLKETTSLCPKWNADDNVTAFTKRIGHAWTLCHAGDCDQAQFCAVLRLNLPQNAAEVFDSLPPNDQKDVQKVTEALQQRLGRQESDYLTEFVSATKTDTETHMQFAMRCERLYNWGTGKATSDSETKRDKKMIVEAFIKGLPLQEQSAIRLVASDTELLDVHQLAKRAQRTTKTQKPINLVSESKTSWKQDQKKPKITFACHYCGKTGHSWRRCYKRASTNPEWKPTKEYSAKPKVINTDTEKSDA